MYICHEMCDTCIFAPGNLMHLNPGRLKGMVNETRSKDGGSIVCHKTLNAEQNLVCRGWFDRYAHEDMILRLAIAMDIITER